MMVALPFRKCAQLKRSHGREKIKTISIATIAALALSTTAAHAEPVSQPREAEHEHATLETTPEGRALLSIEQARELNSP